ncbi:ABC transporter permease [Diplocloster agilis]|uniref:ABC transporter permease n=1 Tax=Diplocloster agilis TaxID=2850323 RepID=UPI0008222B0E|nr:ABC transporter permease [Suonthocola fibrivorans]MCU6736274.1 ABC transporter permease [Suonthocola fibrivorans]SCJ88598.1 Glutathione transport system permease protein gsiD [uncultured Clostridium sp.]
MKKDRRNLNFILGCVICAVMLILIILGFFYTPYGPDAMNGPDKFAAPSLRHLMGADQFGRDIFSRVLKGLGTTGWISLVTVAIGGLTGTLVGALTGYYGGILDEILMRINDILTAFPSFLLALVFISVLGPGKGNLIMALSIAFIPSFARVVRGEFLLYRERDYVKSAKLWGASGIRIMFIHILPNALPVILSSAAIGFNNAVLAEASLSYLGIGVQPPDASLGRMISEASAYLFSAPWCAVFPGVMIILLILGFGMISDGLKR